MHRFVAPICGFAAVASLASVLIGLIVLTSPDTHANLWESAGSGYRRTPPGVVGQEVGDVELLLDDARDEFGLRGNPGRFIYLSRGCATCHGLDARGGPVGPSLVGVSTKTVERLVREGRGGMPKYSEDHLGPSELANLAAYLGALSTPRPGSEEIAALQRLTFDPAVPVDTLLRGKAAIRRSCGACHAQPDARDIEQAFESDAEAAGLVAEMLGETNLSLEDARAIAHYMLAIRNGADPVKVP